MARAKMRLSVASSMYSASSWAHTGQANRTHRTRAHACSRSIPCGAARAIWTRPTPDRDADFVKPAYIPSQPAWEPTWREEDRPLYAPPPEFRPAELPDKEKEMPAGPKMPERRPDPIPAGNPKEKPGEGVPDKREAPPASAPKEAPPAKK